MAVILIVEDGISINELIKKNLQLVGHQCTSAFDGETAIFEIQSHIYDLIILDIILPELFRFYPKHVTAKINLTVFDKQFFTLSPKIINF